MTDTILRFEQITGLEDRDVRKATGRSIGEIGAAARIGDSELFYVLDWLERRRNGEPDLTYDEVLAQPIIDVMRTPEEIGELSDEDPTTAKSGKP